MKYFAIFLILIGSVGTTFAIPEFSSDQIAIAAEVILKGQVISYTEQGKFRYYEIAVDEYIKNPQPEDTVIMRSYKPEFIDLINPYNYFEEGDYVFAYLRHLDETRYYSTNFSHEIESLESYGRYDHKPSNIPESVLEVEPPPEPKPKTPIVFDAPLKQHKRGIPMDEINCNRGFQLLIKKNTNTPACVKFENVYRIIERGWAQNLVDKNGSAFDAAEKFLEISPTYQFDGVKEGSGIVHRISDYDANPPKHLLQASFIKKYYGYGDRTNQELVPLPDYDNRAEMMLVIDGVMIKSAIINNEWDELNQKYIVESSESFENFIVRFQKTGGITGGEERYKIDSKIGVLRIGDNPEDHFVLVSREDVQPLWQAIDSSGIVSKESRYYEPNPSCADCIEYMLSIETSETRKEFSWSDGITLDDDSYYIIIEQIENLIQEFGNKYTFE